MREGTPRACKGALGTWQLQESPDFGPVNNGAPWEANRREAKVRTGLGKSHRPGSQGGLRKRGPWWNEAPTSPIERASAGNSPPKVVRAADLSRPSRGQSRGGGPSSGA